jgi:ComF family protein
MFYTYILSFLRKIIFPIYKNKDTPIETKLYKKDGIYYILNYRDKKIRDLIHRIKFSNDKEGFQYIGKEISKYIKEIENIILLPTPQTKNRLRERGYDVTNTLVKEIQKHRNIKNGYGTLKNIRKDVQSKIKNREERINSAAGTIKLVKEVKGKRFIIIDDVFTTGSTIREIEKLIQNKGGEVVYSICIAH